VGYARRAPSEHTSAMSVPNVRMHASGSAQRLDASHCCGPGMSRIGAATAAVSSSCAATMPRTFLKNPWRMALDAYMTSVPMP
jgi:hypothetical protein